MLVEPAGAFHDYTCCLIYKASKSHEQVRLYTDLRAQLAAVNDALDNVTKVIADTPAQRIVDAFAHNALVTDAAVFDAEKAEQSVRMQCTQWMEAANLAGKELAAEREARERLETGEAYATVSGNAVYWQKRAETAERERDEARQFGEMAAARYNELLKDKTLRCAFCGAEYPPGTPSFQHEALTHHVLHCVAHPMRAIEAERDEAVAELARVREAVERAVSDLDNEDPGAAWAELANLFPEETTDENKNR